MGVVIDYDIVFSICWVFFCWYFCGVWLFVNFVVMLNGFEFFEYFVKGDVKNVMGVFGDVKG